MLWVFKLRQLCWKVLATRVPVATRHNRALPPSNEDPGTRRAWSGFLAKFLRFNTGPSIELWITPPSTNNSTQKHGKTYIDKQDCIGPMPYLGFEFCMVLFLLDIKLISNIREKGYKGGRSLRQVGLAFLNWNRHPFPIPGQASWNYTQPFGSPAWAKCLNLNICTKIEKILLYNICCILIDLTIDLHLQ